MGWRGLTYYDDEIVCCCFWEKCDWYVTPWKTVNVTPWKTATSRAAFCVWHVTPWRTVNSYFADAAAVL